MLDNIISLADLLTRQKTYKAELIDEVRGSNTKMGRLYENVANGKLKTEEEAAAFLGYSGTSDKNYSNLKGRLFQRMINSVFFIDQSGPNYEDTFRAAMYCHKNYTAVKILFGNRKNSVGAKLARNTLKQTTKFEFTDLNYLLSAILSNYYLTFKKDLKKYKKYSAKRKEFLQILELENEVEELYATFNLRLSNSSENISYENMKSYELEILKIGERLNENSSSKLLLSSYLLMANFYLESKKYEDIITIVDQALEKLKHKKIKSQLADYTLRTRAAIANLLLKNYNSAEKILEQNKKLTEPSTTNWYYTQHLIFSLYLLRFQYQSAYRILNEVFGASTFKTITHPLLVQLFKIKEAYIHFLVELGKINPEESDEKPLRKFRLNRFLNDVPTYSKDKRGVNISILIIQMLLLVQNKKHGLIIDKLDALNMYSHRYLRSNNTFRSNCFIKMLTKLPDADYHPIRWQRYVEKYRKRLDEHPFELSYHNLDLEVIPFETLYDLVVEMLEKQKGVVRN